MQHAGFGNLTHEFWKKSRATCDYKDYKVEEVKGKGVATKNTHTHTHTGEFKTSLEKTCKFSVPSSSVKKIHSKMILGMTCL